MSSKKSKKAAAKRKNEKAKKARSLEAARDAELNKSEAEGGNPKDKAKKETAKASKKANAKPAGKKEKTKKDKTKKVKKEKSAKEKVKRVKKPRAPGLWKAAVEKIKGIRLPRQTKRIIAAVAVLFFLAAAALLLYSRLSYNVPDQAVQSYTGRDEEDFNLRSLEQDIGEQLEQVKGLGIRGDKDAFKFFVSAKEFTIDEYSDNIALTLANVSSNKCKIIGIILDEDDNILYVSLGIPAGKYLPSIRLPKELPYGEHKLRLVVSAFDNETKERIGVQHMNLKLVIGLEKPTQETTKE